MYLLEDEVPLWSYWVDTRRTSFAYLWRRLWDVLVSHGFHRLENGKAHALPVRAASARGFLSGPWHHDVLSFHNICLWLQGPVWVLPHSCFEWVTWRAKSLVSQAGCLECLLISSSKQVSCGIFSVGRKRNPSSHFLTCSTLITLGEKQLCSQLCLIGVVFCCLFFLQLE